MEQNGYIKLYRQMMDWEWFSDCKTLSVFLFLLLSANHKDASWRGIKILRGQTITTLDKIHSKTGVSLQSVRTCLANLKRTGSISINSTSRYSIITVCKYDSYQCDDIVSNTQANNQLTNNQHTANNQLTNNQHTTNNQLTTNKNKENKENEENEENERPTLSEDNVRVSDKPASVSKKKTPSLVTQCRKVFEQYFVENYETPYYWTAKDAVAMKRLISKLKFSRESCSTPMPTDDESIVDAFKNFLGFIHTDWLLNNLDVPTIDSQYNKILAAKNNKHKSLEQSMQVGVRMGLTDGRDLPDDMSDYLNPKNYM